MAPLFSGAKKTFVQFLTRALLGTILWNYFEFGLVSDLYNSNEIPILNSNNSVGHLTQVNQFHLSKQLAFTTVLNYTA